MVTVVGGGELPGGEGEDAVTLCAQLGEPLWSRGGPTRWARPVRRLGRRAHGEHLAKAPLVIRSGGAGDEDGQALALEVVGHLVETQAAGATGGPPWRTAWSSGLAKPCWSRRSGGQVQRLVADVAVDVEGPVE